MDSRRGWKKLQEVQEVQEMQEMQEMQEVQRLQLPLSEKAHWGHQDKPLSALPLL